MGHLEDLKRQSKTLNQKKNRRDNGDLEDQNILQRLQLGLKLIFDYLEELVSVLHEVKPQLAVSYNINRYGTLTDLYQQGYEVKVDNPENPQKITLCFECLDEKVKELFITVEGRDKFLRQRNYMWQNNLCFKEKLSMDGRGSFFLEPRVHVQFIFTPDTKQRNIKLQIRNLLEIGSMERWLAPEKINKVSLDHDLGGLILRKIKDLDHLSTGKMTADMRQQIQDSVKRERERQMQIEDRIAAEELAEQEARIANKIRRKLNAPVSEVLQGFLKKVGRRQSEAP